MKPAVYRAIAKALKVRSENIISWELLCRQFGQIITHDGDSHARLGATDYRLRVKVFADSTRAEFWKEESEAFKVYKCDEWAEAGTEFRQAWDLSAYLFSGPLMASIFQTLAASVKVSHRTKEVKVAMEPTEPFCGPKRLSAKETKVLLAKQKLKNFQAIQEAKHKPKEQK